MGLSKSLWLSVLSIGILALGACSIPERGPAVPAADTARALPLGIPNARFFADEDPKAIVDEATRAFEREQAALRAEGKSTTRLSPVYYLAVSGGGDNGGYELISVLQALDALAQRAHVHLPLGIDRDADHGLAAQAQQR